MSARIDRRRTLMGGAALIGLGIAGPRPARSDTDTGTDDAEARIRAFTGGAIPREGRIALDLPEIAENGGAVRLDLRVDSPMTAEDHVRRVMVVAHGNPSAGVAEFRFSPLSAVAEVATRIRLGQSQIVTAVAEMGDGSFYAASREVQVTVGGCVA